MKFFLFLFLCVSAPSFIFAYEVVISEVREPYEVMPLSGDVEEKRALVGTLDNFPVMYEAVVKASTTLSLQLAQRYQEIPLGLSLMVVRVDDTGGGVTEIARVSLGATDWQTRKDSMLGMTFLESKVISTEIGSGTYRIEVSTPDNLGSYLLTVGEIDTRSSYLKTLQSVRQVQKNFGYSVFALLWSSYLYYPLGILFMLIVLERTWKYRTKIVYGR